MTENHSLQYSLALQWAQITHQISVVKRAPVHPGFVFSGSKLIELIREPRYNFLWDNDDVMVEMIRAHVSLCRIVAMLEKELDHIANLLDNPDLCKVALAMLEGE